MHDVPRPLLHYSHARVLKHVEPVITIQTYSVVVSPVVETIPIKCEGSENIRIGLSSVV